mgnify:CR=1 FL=1|jgi:hypothetical protein
MIAYDYPYNNKIRKTMKSRYSNQMSGLAWEPDLTISSKKVGRGDKTHYQAGVTPARSQPYLNSNELSVVNSGNELKYIGKGIPKQIISSALDVAPHVAGLVSGLVAPEFAPVSVPVVTYTGKKLRNKLKEKTGYGIDLKKLNEFGIDVNKLTDTSRKYIDLYKDIATNLYQKLQKPNNKLILGGQVNGAGIFNKIKPYAKQALSYGLDMTLPKAGDFIGHFLGEQLGNEQLGAVIGNTVSKKLNKYLQTKLKLNEKHGSGVGIYQGGNIIAPSPSQQGTLNDSLTIRKRRGGAKSGGDIANPRKISDKMVRRNKKIKEIMKKNKCSLIEASREIKAKKMKY